MVRTPEVTNRIMSAIKSKNTEPEMLMRKALWAKGLRYRVNFAKLPGKPDIVFTRSKVAVFCDGDFWHGHNWVLRGIPSLEEELAQYSEYWRNKILENIRRDKEENEKLATDGWFVIRLWESEIRTNTVKCEEIVERAVRERLDRRRRVAT